MLYLQGPCAREAHAQTNVYGTLLYEVLCALFDARIDLDESVNTFDKERAAQTKGVSNAKLI